MTETEGLGDRSLTVRGLRLAVVLLVSVVAAGTAGYMVIEGWNAWDAFYMTVTTITTVGFHEVHDLEPRPLAGQVFTAVLILVGVGSALYSFSFLAALFVEGTLHQRFEKRRRQRMISNLSDHFILCGYGRIGTIIAAEFRRERVSYVVVERDPDRVHGAIEAGELAVAADASSEEVLRRVGIEKARGLIAAVGTDAENVYTVLTARGMRPDLLIIGRAESDDSSRKLLRAGATRVILPYQIGAVQMAQTALRPAVVDFVQLATSSENLELAMEQISIADTSSLAGHSIRDSSLRQRFGVIVVGIQRRGGRMEFNPPADAALQAGDQLVVLGEPQSLRSLELAAGA